MEACPEEGRHSPHVMALNDQSPPLKATDRLLGQELFQRRLGLSPKLLWNERAVIALRSTPAVAKCAVKTKAGMERSAMTVRLKIQIHF